jgi:ABC-type sugar transport system ATPase subunit
MSIQIKGVSKQFDNGVLALDDINLNIQKGEFIALLGPSGCGKSTTLMMLAGLYKPTQGEIFFGERVVNDLEPKDRNIGMVFQSYALYPHMTVRDNIAFPLKHQKVPKEERYRRAEEMAKLVRIDNLMDRKPNQLSGGQQQRVSMARALVKNPDVLLLDEPMSNLDTRLKIEVREEIRRIQKKLGVTAIIVTHDQEEAMAIADRIAVLDNGKIQQFATPDQLFLQPKNMFVAHFMGNPPMNFIEGKLLFESGKSYIISEHFRYEIPDQVQIDKRYNGKEVTLGVRPHLLKVRKEKENGICAKVLFVEYLGREALVQASVGEEVVRALVEPHEVGQIGETIYLHPEVRGVQVFFNDTGENISL